MHITQYTNAPSRCCNPNAEVRHLLRCTELVIFAFGFCVLLTSAKIAAAQISDDFRASRINSNIWSFVDPRGDSQARIVATGGDSQLAIAVPAGSVHDPWIQSNTAARLLQDAPAGDFAVEVAFSSVPDQSTEMQGIIIEGAEGAFLRFDFYSRSSSTLYLFAARVQPGSSTVYTNRSIATGSALWLRVGRKGNTWTATYSYNGTQFSPGAQFVDALQPARVGVFAGNAGNAPAHEVRVDYFFNQASPIVPEDGGAVSAPAAALTSDDFNTRNLNTAVWRFIDPTGDAQLRMVGAGSGNARVELEIPGGSLHGFENRRVNAPRIVQTVPNRDFELEVKFDSALTQRHQIQGIVVQADAANFQRFDFYSDGSAIKSFVGSYRNGAQTTRKNAVVPLSPPFYMRVKRAGSTWTQSYSNDGARWTTHVSFTDAMPVSQVGLFAANEHSDPQRVPAFTLAADYMFDRAAVIQPEDGGVAGTDLQRPLVHGVLAAAAGKSLVVSWKTDEPTRGTVRYGLSQQLELGSAASGTLAHSHSLTIPVQAAGTYYVRIDAQDAARNQTLTPLSTVAVSGIGGSTGSGSTTGGPTIELFYGTDQAFGHIGLPQNYVNILGNVRDPDGVASLSYSLNGAAHQPLSQGPNKTRLLNPGDFNADIETSRLRRGANVVEIRAVDSRGNPSSVLVDVLFDGTKSWPTTYTANWSQAVEINDIAQVIDGRWAIEDDRVLGTVIRPQNFGYDRLVGIGQGARNQIGSTPTWVNYEVTVPITIHAFDPDPAAYASPSNGPAVGFVLRWPGHTVRNRAQPVDGFRPLGAFISYRVRETGSRLVIVGNDSAQAGANRVLQLGTTYIFKVRVQTVAAGPRYFFKVWPQSQAEPSGWNVQLQQDPSQPASGSVALVAHHVDASFGNVRIVRLP